MSNGTEMDRLKEAFRRAQQQLARPGRTLRPVGEALQSFLTRKGLQARISQAEVVNDWAELVGPQIAAVTTPDSVTADGVLRVRVATAAWANELSLMAPRILARVNAGRDSRIREIRWMAGG